MRSLHPWLAAARLLTVAIGPFDSAPFGAAVAVVVAVGGLVAVADSDPEPYLGDLLQAGFRSG